MGILVARGKDRWACVVYLGRTVDAAGKVKQRRLWRTVRGTKQEAQRVLSELEQKHQRRELDYRRETVGDYLRRWLDEIAPRSAGPTTLASYRMIVEKHLLPFFGVMRLDRLTPKRINDYIGEALARGRSKKHPGFKKTATLSAETVRRHYRVLHKALEDAVTVGALVANPAARSRVKIPRRDRKEMRTLTEVQAIKFLEAAKASRLFALYELALNAGMRQAELLGARWSDLNLALGVLSIQQIYYRGVFKAPKTERSRRPVELDEHLVAALRRHQEQQDREKDLLGSAYEDQGLIFAQVDGRPLNGQSLARHEYRRLLTAAGCPVIRFHDLRHTAATLMLQGGEHPKVVSDALGHSGIGITMDLYSHTIPGMQRQAVARLTQRRRDLQAALATQARAQAEPIPAPIEPVSRVLQSRVH